MSGRRAKALRKAFYQLHHRAPETTATRTRGVFGKVWKMVTTKKKDGTKVQEGTYVPIVATTVADSYSEWRRFKRAWASR